MYNPTYILVPIDLCFFSLSKKFERPFQLYTHLKVICDGKIKIGKREFDKIAKDLGIKSHKTVLSSLRLLQERNWVGYNPFSKYYFIRGFDAVMRTEGLSRRTAAEFDHRDIKKFKAFIAGVVIGYLADSQKRKKRGVERQMRRSKQAPRQSSDYCRVALMGIAKILGISRAKASRIKIQAHKARFIKVKHKFRKFGFSPLCGAYYKKTESESANKVVYRKKNLYEQLPDEVIPLIRFKKRKKMRTY